MEENVIQVNGEIMINVNVNVKNAMYVKKIMFAILLNVIVKTEKKLASITDDSAITCDEIKESNDEDAAIQSHDETNTIPTNFNEKKTTCKTQNFYILFFIFYFNLIFMYYKNE